MGRIPNRCARGRPNIPDTCKGSRGEGRPEVEASTRLASLRLQKGLLAHEVDWREEREVEKGVAVRRGGQPQASAWLFARRECCLCLEWLCVR